MHMYMYMLHGHVPWHHLAFLTIVAAKARMSFKAKLAMQLEVRFAKVFGLASASANRLGNGYL